MILGVLAEVVGKLAPGGNAPGDIIKPALDKIATQVDKYESEKQEIEAEARALEHESKHEFQKHHLYAMGIAAFQVGIVMASISILVRYRVVWIISLVGGAVGIVFVIAGLVV
jgi:hypothetical protein